MKIDILCFSQTGLKTGMRLKEGLLKHINEKKDCCIISLYGKSRYLSDSISESHTEWTQQHFRTADVLIYIGACGIAVRSIAPFVKSKKTDPAVLVIDECGRYVISLLSGHLGGANAFAEEAARILGALPVITTASDLRGKFAVDLFAKSNGCAVFPMEAAKEASAALLHGEPVGFYSEFPWEGELPEGILVCDKDGLPVSPADIASAGMSPSAAGTGKAADSRLHIGIAISIYDCCTPFKTTVHIVPPAIALGIGCRKDMGAEVIEQFVLEILEESHIARKALECIASIDLKREETGIKSFAEKWQLPFLTFSSQELMKVPGDFSYSDFVSSITGADNVCERSAVLAGRHGRLISPKRKENGVTAALAVRDMRIYFE